MELTSSLAVPPPAILRRTALLRTPPADPFRPASPGADFGAASDTPAALRPRRVLLLSVSAGAGHVRAAQALQATLVDSADVRASHLDVMQFVAAPFRRIYVDLYLALVNRYPMAWGALYAFMQRADGNSRLQRLRRFTESLCTRRLLREVRAAAPDAIVCTHFLPAELLSRLVLSGELGCPVWVQVTDFDLHPMWVQPGIAGYFAANQEVAFRMRAAGIRSQRIHVTGIPVMPAFAAPPDRAAAARALGLDASRTTLLLMGGGAGLGSLVDISARLMTIRGDFQLVVLAGRNAAVLAALQALAAQFPGRLRALGFINHVESIMAMSDLAITKPGGLTTSECLAMGLPMVLASTIPGQEERNADYLLEQGAALKASDLPTLEFRIRQLLANPVKLAEMSSRARAIGRPDAAGRVMQRVTGRFTA